MTKTALITGGSGQDGSYLIELLADKGYAIHAHSLQGEQPSGSGATWHLGDLAEPGIVEKLLDTVQPDEVYNLAAMSVPAVSWQMPYQTTQLNALVPIRICEWLAKNRPACRFFQASSSEIFGDVQQDYQDELTPMNPRSPYGMTKAFAQQIVRTYREQHRLHASSGILFNHESPRRPLRFVSQKIAHAAAAISLGLTQTKELDERGLPVVQHSKLSLGNIQARRDFGFAGDTARAMHLIVQSDAADDYVVGTGENRSIAEFCEAAFHLVGLDWRKHVTVASDLVRAVDSKATRANSRKLQEKTGWRAEVSFEQLVALMVNERIRLLTATNPALAKQ
jgi:GDPmannose 4,6-dehydratase